MAQVLPFLTEELYDILCPEIKQKQAQDRKRHFETVARRCLKDPVACRETCTN